MGNCNCCSSRRRTETKDEGRSVKELPQLPSAQWSYKHLFGSSQSNLSMYSMSFIARKQTNITKIIGRSHIVSNKQLLVVISKIPGVPQV